MMLGAGLLMAAMIALLPIWGKRIGGIAGSIVNVVLLTAIQRAIPSHLMGHVMGLLLFGSFGVYPLSVTLAGMFFNQLGPESFFPVGGSCWPWQCCWA